MNRLSQWLFFLFAASGVASGGLLVMALLAEHSRLDYDFGKELTAVSLVGQYRIADNPPQPFPPNPEVLSTFIKDPVVFDGHFTSAIPAGEPVFVRVRHVRGSLSVNGKELFSVGGEQTHPFFMASPGNIWATFKSPGISTTDDVHISVQAVHPDFHPRHVEFFLNSVCYGSAWGVLNQRVFENGWLFFFGAFLGAFSIVFSVILLTLAILFRRYKEEKLTAQSLALAGMYFFSGIWELIDYETLSLVFPWPAFIVCLETLSQLFAAAFMIMYLSILMSGSRREFTFGVLALILSVLLVVVLLQMTGTADLLPIQKFLYIFSMICIFMALVCLFREEKGRIGLARKTVLGFIPIGLLGTIELVLYNLGSIYNGTIAGIGIIATALIQVALLINTAYKNIERVGQLERQVVESRIAVSLSQIKPHFLYNVLTSIHYLCTVSPKEAERAINHFARFLRGNLDSLSSFAPIPVERELEHVRQYLALEEIRFGDRLHIKWDLGASGFLVPALSVQPLVENASRWGMRERGITITITTSETEEAWNIIVSDDGRGFDPFAPNFSEHSGLLSTPRKSGVGLNSIRTRLADMCGGTLHVVSEINKGTTATITIPRLHPPHAKGATG